MTNNAITSTGGYNNPHYRAQELYLKVDRFMEIVKIILKGEGKTAFPAWLSSRDMKTFIAAVRSASRAD
ncbi:hypothetical protein LQW54_000248 [Pestalotiopsis sp. IQ-011]